MVRADLTERDFLWPSSQTALEYYQSEHGKPMASETILNNSHRSLYIYTCLGSVTEVGMVTTQNDVYYLDMVAFTDLFSSGQNG